MAKPQPFIASTLRTTGSIVLSGIREDAKVIN
jgi:hypothetical protein